MNKNNKNQRITYTFRRLPGSERKVLLCPECGETLFSEDIEQYSACPYCSKSFTMTTDLEDFLLNTIIDRWQHFNLPETNESYIQDYSRKNTSQI